MSSKKVVVREVVDWNGWMVRLEGMKQVPGRQVVPLTRLHSIQCSFTTFLSISLLITRTLTVKCTLTTQFRTMSLSPSLASQIIHPDLLRPFSFDSTTNNDSRRTLHIQTRGNLQVIIISSDRFLLPRRHTEKLEVGKLP